MTIWIIEPRDPLIVRDGRPFGPNPGARASTLPFPLPSTIVGGLRHKAGLDQEGTFDRAAVNFVLSLSLRGPLLAELGNEGALVQLLFPAPADALALAPETENLPEPYIRVQRLFPQRLAGAPLSNQPEGMAFIAPAERVPNKVSSKAPRFWSEAVFMNWLSDPRDDELRTISGLGLGVLKNDARTHVSVRPETQTARDGALFQTRGLEFTWRDSEAQRTKEAFLTKRLALAAAFEQGHTPYSPAYFVGGLAPLGGERRLMRWSTVERSLPTPPAGMFEHIIATRRARVVLLTPALFDSQRADDPTQRVVHRPPLQWLRGGVAATLIAAAVARPQVVSGWDMNADNGVDEQGRAFPRGKPKPTRRLAPAGAVYFITWPEGADVSAWLRATWMQNVSDAEQDCRDGFGLAAIGAWPRREENGL